MDQSLSAALPRWHINSHLFHRRGYRGKRKQVVPALDAHLPVIFFRRLSFYDSFERKDTFSGDRHEWFFSAFTFLRAHFFLTLHIINSITLRLIDAWDHSIQKPVVLPRAVSLFVLHHP